MKYIIVIVAFIITFFFYLLGLMKLVPIYFSAPPLFIFLLYSLWILNNRNRFKGF